jgi:HK97 family phage prohead protease
MPYFIGQHPDCEGEWSVVKEDGTLLACHTTKDNAIAQMVAVSLAENIEPAGEYTGEYRSETRAVDLTPPAYMRAAARQGLRYYEEGKGGDGLVSKTIAEARAMANGTVTADKWVRLRAWIARHLVDLEAPDANPNSENYPSAGVVAHLLWGSGPSLRGAQRALDYADRVVTRLEEENAGRARGQALSKIETRIWQNDFEVREEAEGMRLTGYAARFGEWSEPLPFREIIKRGAFRRSLDSRNDIKLLWNHDSSKVLGSTRAKTLKLEEREEGLWVDALLPDTSYGRDAKVSIQRGDVTGFSFGFSVPAGGDAWNSEGTERTLKSVRLIEVSTGVAFPAYPSTNGTAQVRGLEIVAERAYVDVDDLADAIVLMEAGGKLPTEAANILRKVIDALAEEEEMEEQEPTVGEIVADATETNAAPEPDMGDVSVLELIKKKLYLLERN